MEELIYLIPVALFLGLVGLAAFIWALKIGQMGDLDDVTERVLSDAASTDPIMESGALPSSTLRRRDIPRSR